MAEKRFKYTACGLDNIYLGNGFSIEKASRGRIVRIEDLQGLHRAIGEMLVRQKRSLVGVELRFLRQELGLSQSRLAGMLGESEQSVARREKREKQWKRPTAQERIIRYMYEQYIEGSNETLSEFLNLLGELDDVQDTAIEFENDGKWHRAEEGLAA